MKTIIFCLAVLVSISTINPAFAKIYKCENSAGRTSYSEDPCADESKAISSLPTNVSSNSMAEWVQVTAHDSGYIYADPLTIIRDGNRVKMWTLVDYGKPKIISRQIKPIMSMKAQIEFDCDMNMSRMISTFTYSENMGVGEASDLSKTGPRGFEKSKEWAKISSGNIGPGGSKFLEFACERLQSMPNDERAYKSTAPYKTTPNYYRLSSPPTVQMLYSACQFQKKEMMEKCNLIAAHINKMEKRLNNLCLNAGENIIQTANDVEGVYINFQTHPSQGYFHEDERFWDSYVSPRMGKNYKYWEMNMPWKNNLIGSRTLIPRDYSRPGDIEYSYKELEKPNSQYGITWKGLTTKADQRDNLFGDELTIYQIKTGKTMAVRHVFFYVIRDDSVSIGEGRYIQPPEKRYANFVRTCPNYSPTDDEAYKDLRPRHSYEFVSRVLKPKPPYRER